MRTVTIEYFDGEYILAIPTKGEGFKPFFTEDKATAVKKACEIYGADGADIEIKIEVLDE